jgi:hypothetical protein
MLTQRYPRSSTYMYAKNNEVYFSTWKPKKLKKQNKKQTNKSKIRGAYFRCIYKNV